LRDPNHPPERPRIRERTRLRDDLEPQAAIERERSRERRLEIAKDTIGVGLLKNGAKQGFTDSPSLECRLDPPEDEVPVRLGRAQPFHTAKPG
jgi:hypothetical protein